MPPVGPGRVGSPSRRQARVREGSGGPVGGPGGVGRHFRRATRGRQGSLPQDRDARQQGREGSGGPPGSPGVVGRSSWKSGRGRVAVPEVWEVLRGPSGGS